MEDNRKLLVSGISKLWGRIGENYTRYIEPSPHYMDFIKKNNLSYREYDLITDDYKDYLVHDLNHNVLKCVKCGDTSKNLEPCNNCGNKSELEWRGNFYGHLNETKFRCKNCNRIHQQIRWSCDKCGCDNSIGSSLFHWIEIKGPLKKEGCFIATVCYGDYDNPEVMFLRKFRDEKLLKYYAGRLFVSFYYFVSPFFATLISKSDNLRKIVRHYLLEPIVSKLKRQNKLS